MSRAVLLLVLSLLLFMYGTVVHAAHPVIDSLQPVAGTSPDIPDTLWTDIVETGSDALRFFSAPARFSLRDLGTVGWIAAGTGMTMVADDRIRRAFSDGHTTTLDDIADVANSFGTLPPVALIAGGLYVGGLVFDDPGVRRAGRHVFQSVLYAAVITTTLKSFIGRARPFLNEGPYSFHGVSLKDQFNALPSGHSTVVFAISSSLAAEIDNPWATAGLHSLAMLTALSRIYVDRHWGSDVFLGAAVGMACGYGVAGLYDSPDGATGLIITPTMNGVMATWTF